MHRLLVETTLLSEESPVLPKDAANHLKVLRPKAGEEVELFDGKGRWRVYSWENGLHSNRTIEHSEQSNKSLTLFACVTKGSRWDWTIEKATELGVTRIVPVISDRTIVRIPKDERAAKRERWQRIAEDAARQSDAKWLPEICEAVDFRDSLALVRETTCFIGALTNPPSPPLISSVRRRLSQPIEQSNNRPILSFRRPRRRLHAGGAGGADGDRDADVVRADDPPRRDGGDLRGQRPCGGAWRTRILDFPFLL